MKTRILKERETLVPKIISSNKNSVEDTFPNLAVISLVLDGQLNKQPVGILFLGLLCHLDFLVEE